MDSKKSPSANGKPIAIGSLELGIRPCIAAVVDAIVPVETLAGLHRDGVDLFEVRVDLIDIPLAEMTDYLGGVRSVGAPLIGTVRENSRTAGNRLRIFEAIMPQVDCVDIELGSQLGSDVVMLARGLGKKVIVSEHDFERTPGDDALQAIVDAAAKQGGDIVKIATMARDTGDALRLLRFVSRCAMPIVAFAMGEAGTFSRVEACGYGSLFTYGYISQPVAPGQLSALELVRRMGEGRKMAGRWQEEGRLKSERRPERM